MFVVDGCIDIGWFCYRVCVIEVFKFFDWGYLCKFDLLCLSVDGVGFIVCIDC